MSADLVVHPAGAWADAVAAELTDRLRAEPRLRICLPTGSTPAPLYEALVRDGPADLWADATVIVLDDYVGLPADDPAGGGPRLRQDIVDHVRPGRFVTLDRGADPAEAVRDLDAAAAEGMDLVLLGLGLNGHVGLNEPGSDADAPTRVVELHDRSRQVAAGYGATEVPKRGITLGMDRLLEAREIWLLVTGESKAEVLRRALEGPIGPEVPASLLRTHPRFRVLADEPAAALLSRP